MARQRIHRPCGSFHRAPGLSVGPLPEVVLDHQRAPRVQEGEDLVPGPALLDGQGKKGSKQVKAEELNAAGANIKIISETAFLQMLAARLTTSLGRLLADDFFRSEKKGFLPDNM